MLSLLALIGFALYLNRQLVVQRQSAFARAEYTSVHHVAQLNREHLRLYALIQADPVDFVPATFTQQRNLVNSRVTVLVNLYQGIYQPNLEPPELPMYAQAWTALQEPLDALTADPANSTLRHQLLAQFMEMELLINTMMRNRQLSFEDRVADWIASSATLANLIMVGSVIFGALVCLTAYSIFHFIGEQHRSAEALRASEQRHRALLETIPDAVLRVRRDGTLRDCKPATAFTSHPLAAPDLGKPLAEVLPPPIARLYEQAIEQTLQDDQPQVIEYQAPANGEQDLRNLEARVLPSGRNEVQIIVRDVTEQKRAEQRQQQAHKLESLGLLAGGIAHDFNNLLAAMLGQASLAKLRLAKGLPVEEQIDKTITAAERAADLTRQLLAYTGRGKFQITQLDLNQLIRENMDLLKTALSNRAELQLALADALPLVEADRGQIQQVVMNLVINAAEAVPDRGFICVRTYVQSIESAQELSRFTGNALAPGVYVFLQVSDNGIGMDAALLSRIFDPFFSTKSHGHGLGLAATLGILRTHHAGIQVQSQPGQGTTFTLLFPISTQKQTELAMQTEPTIAKTSGQRSVLVIDDEPYVRAAVADILQSEELPVIVAASGEDGVKQYRRHQAEIGVVLLDMKMPGMSGEETHRALRELNAEVKVILSSGYNESEINRTWHELGIFAFLQKPYNVDLLLHHVQQALAATS